MVKYYRRMIYFIRVNISEVCQCLRNFADADKRLSGMVVKGRGRRVVMNAIKRRSGNGALHGFIAILMRGLGRFDHASQQSWEGRRRKNINASEQSLGNKPWLDNGGYVKPVGVSLPQARAPRCIASATEGLRHTAVGRSHRISTFRRVFMSKCLKLKEVSVGFAEGIAAQIVLLSTMTMSRAKSVACSVSNVTKESGISTMISIFCGKQLNTSTGGNKQ